MVTKSRSEILKDFRNQISQGKILVGVGAGTGITAKCSEKADVDMLIIYNSGRFRMAGRGSLSGLLAYGDANKIVVEMGYEVLPVAEEDTGTGRRLRNRSVPCHGHLFKGAESAGL